MAVRHPYQCKECELSFISVPHVKFHTKTIHDTPCDICGLLFEFKCIETGVEKMKFSDVIQNQTEYIDILEKDLMLEVIRKGVSNIELKKKLQGAVMKLDRGANDENMNELCNLAFLPGWAVPKLSQNPNSKAAADWVKKEVYMNSLERQVQDASSSSIYECDVSTTCDEIFFDFEKVGHHRAASHNMLMSGSGQKSYFSDTYNEHMSPGMRNQAKYMSRNESQNRNIGIIYTPSSTYRDVETPMWVSKNGNKQSTIDMINKVNSKIGSSVMYGKQRTTDASFHME